MSSSQSEMPQYRCHKVVHALQIKDVRAHDVSFQEAGYEPIHCPPAMFARYSPVPGDYYVVYPGDGYASFSPKKAFEEGYTLIERK